MNRLSKKEWIDKVYKDYALINHSDLPIDDDKFWWFRISQKNGLRLSEFGFQRFNAAKIYFYEFKILINIVWTPVILLGLSRMPCPHYIERNSYKTTVWITDEDIAMLFKLNDLNVELFARGFLNAEIV
jgi:hypothetical protein